MVRVVPHFGLAATDGFRTVPRLLPYAFDPLSELHAPRNLLIAATTLFALVYAVNYVSCAQTIIVPGTPGRSALNEPLLVANKRPR